MPSVRLGALSASRPLCSIAFALTRILIFISRAVAQIALVDQYEKLLANLYVKPEEKIFR
eukprot:1374379-Amorphochlora_amoeboformis.AAC.3